MSLNENIKSFRAGYIIGQEAIEQDIEVVKAEVIDAICEEHEIAGGSFLTLGIHVGTLSERFNQWMSE